MQTPDHSLPQAVAVAIQVLAVASLFAVLTTGVYVAIALRVGAQW